MNGFSSAGKKVEQNPEFGHQKSNLKYFEDFDTNRTIQMVLTILKALGIQMKLNISLKNLKLLFVKEVIKQFSKDLSKHL